MQDKERSHFGFLSMLKNLDIFGETVKFTFRQKGSFQTWFGTFITCAVLTLFTAFAGVRTLKLFNAEDPFFSMMTMAEEKIDPIDLWALNFVFAVEDIDPRAGRIVVEHVKWGKAEGASQSDPYISKIKTPIEMVNCTSLRDEPDFETMHESTK